jgi:hypothetical protein
VLVENRNEPLVRWGFVAALGAVLVVAAGVGVLVLRERIVQHVERRRADAAQGREERVTPAAIVALPPLPVKLPLIERPGKDKHGYPRSYVDRVGLRALLVRGKYRELTQYLEQLQRDFEADFHAEYLIGDAAEAFESAERELEPQLNEWVSATPDSFAPYVARGAYRFAVAMAGRGFDYARNTAKESFAAMDAAFDAGSRSVRPSAGYPAAGSGYPVRARASEQLPGFARLASRPTRPTARIAAQARRPEGA